MSALSHDSASQDRLATALPLRIVPTPAMPDSAARERFAKRRTAGQIAEALALALGRSSAESGTVRLATLLAADAGALKITKMSRAASIAELKKSLPVVTRSKNGKLLQPVI